MSRKFALGNTIHNREISYYEGMPNLVKPIEAIRRSVCALLRQRPKGSGFDVGIVGTAWCVVTDKYFVTAQHTFDEGKPRQTSDKFYLVQTPNNLGTVNIFPVVGFVVEDQPSDLAILEASVACKEVTFPSLDISLSLFPDGTQVLTYGYPAPRSNGGVVDSNGMLTSFSGLLMSHANEGIIASQYPDASRHVFEFNVAWHHGESGGPIFNLETLSAFAIMQSYREISRGNGVLAGPRFGRSLKAIEAQLIKIGAKIV